MNAKTFAVCAAVAIALSAATAQAQTPPAATIKLVPANNQGPAGTATVAQQGSDVVITINGPHDSTTAAFFKGSCGSTGLPKVDGAAQALKPPVNGSSQTVLPGTTVAQVTQSPHAIVMQGGNSPTLCGDVSTMTGQQSPPKP
jgi:hypothetical protein